MNRIITTAVCMLLAAAASAADFTVDGVAYNILQGNQVEVTSLVDGQYADRIVIPSTVDFGRETFDIIAIGDRAFYMNEYLTSVVFPSSVESIGESAFYGCSSLFAITLPEKLASIGDNAFTNSAIRNLSFLSAQCPDFDPASTFRSTIPANVAVPMGNAADYENRLGAWFEQRQKIAVNLTDGYTDVYFTDWHLFTSADGESPSLTMQRSAFTHNCIIYSIPNGNISLWAEFSVGAPHVILVNDKEIGDEEYVVGLFSNPITNPFEDGEIGLSYYGCNCQSNGISSFSISCGNNTNLGVESLGDDGTQSPERIFNLNGVELNNAPEREVVISVGNGKASKTVRL